MARLQLERVNFLWFLTLGVTVVAAGLLVYILLLESALGAFHVRELSPTRLRSALAERAQPRVALLRSAYTRAAYQDLNPGNPQAAAWVDGSTDSWRNFLLDPNRLIRHEEITDQQLEAGDLSRFEVLILPSVLAMSTAQLDAVKAFMDGGGSVLATWSTGLYTPQGAWRGWTFVEEVFGVAFEGFVDRTAGNYRVYQDTFPGTTPAGLYLPDSTVRLGPDAPEPAQASAGREGGFPPLRGYTWWRDTLSSAGYPPSNFARARSLTASLRDATGARRRQDAVEVTYYTWIGGGRNGAIPYPSTDPGVRRFTLRGGTPLTARLPAGYRGKVQVYNPGVKVRTLASRARPAGFWYDFATDKAASAEAVAATTGAVYGTYGRGRFVYLGFQRDAVGGDAVMDREDYLAWGLFFANVMDYLQRKPVTWVHDWPYQPLADGGFKAYEAAALLAGVAGAEVAHFGAVNDLFVREGVAGSYFVRPERDAAQAALLQRLHQDGDVGVLDDLVTDADGSAAFQHQRLDTLRASLARVVGGGVSGYRPMRAGRLGPNTMAGLARSGYTYFLPDSIGRRTVPKVMGSPYQALTRIGYTVHSDHTLREQAAAQQDSIGLWSRLFLDDVRRIHYEGALYRLIYSSDLLGHPDHLGVLDTLVTALKARNFWVPAGDELAHWWRTHNSLNANVEQRGPARLFVRVSNDNGHTAEHAVVRIALPRAVPPGGDVVIRPELVGVGKVVEGLFTAAPMTETIAYALAENNTVLVLAIDALRPQQYRIFHIDIVDAQGLAAVEAD